MKTTRSMIYKLEVERDCGCKASRDYKDAAYNQPHGDISIVYCAGHDEPALKAVLGEVMTECLEKEAKESQAPSPVLASLPPGMRTMDGPSLVAPAATPAQPTQTTVSAAPRPLPRSAGQHRPAQPGKPGGSSAAGFRRASSPTASSHVAAATASVKAAPAIPMDMDGVPEDSRVTRLIESSGVLDEDLDGDDGDEDIDI